MDTVFSFSFKGEAITKSNSTFIKKRGGAFIPDRFFIYETQLRRAALDYAIANKLELFHHGPVSIEITYYLNSNRKKDLTNLPKTTCDALNEVCYLDDSMIVETVLYKKYDKENPRVEIKVFRPENWKERLVNKEWSLPPSLTNPKLTPLEVATVLELSIAKQAALEIRVARLAAPKKKRRKRTVKRSRKAKPRRKKSN